MKNKYSLTSFILFLLYFVLAGCDGPIFHDPSTIDFNEANGEVTKSNVVDLTNAALLASRIPISEPDEGNISKLVGPCVTTLGTDHAVINYGCLAPLFACPGVSGTAEITGNTALFEEGKATAHLTLRNFSVPCPPNDIHWNANLSFHGKVMCGSFFGRTDHDIAELKNGCIHKENAWMLVLDDEGNDVVMKSFVPNEECTRSTVTWIDKNGEQQFKCKTRVADDECFQDINSVTSVSECSVL